MDSQEKTISRLRRKIAKRDTRIKAMQGRICELESALSTRMLDVEVLSRNIERSVSRALCNVRMIPVLGLGKTQRIEISSPCETQAVGESPF